MSFQNHHNELKSNLSKTGIYTISFKNKPNTFYVGSASCHNYPGNSRNGFHFRWWCHFNNLIKNIHCNAHMQNIVNKYGIEILEFKILDFCEPSLCRDLENYWINMLDSRSNGYNIGHVSLKNIRFKMPSHIPELISKQKSKSVAQYELNGKFIRVFKSGKEASDILNISQSQINYAAINGTSAGNYQWRRLNKNYFKNIKSYYPNKLRDLAKLKKVNQYVKNKKEFIKTFDSVNDVVDYLNCSRPNLIRVLKRRYGGTTGNYRGYYWEYDDNK